MREATRGIGLAHVIDEDGDAARPEDRLDSRPHVGPGVDLDEPPESRDLGEKISRAGSREEIGAAPGEVQTHPDDTPMLTLGERPLRRRPVDDPDAPEAAAALGEGIEKARVVRAVAARLDDEGAAHAVAPERVVEEGERADLVRPRLVAGAGDEREAVRL